MLTQEHIHIYIDLKPSINLRPGNVKDLFDCCVAPVEVLFQGGLFPTKGKKNPSSVFFGENVSQVIFNHPAAAGKKKNKYHKS